MTFEYRDAYGRVLTADHGLDDDDNPMAVLRSRGEFGASIPVRIPADRVEEVVAGIRDAARTAARQTTGQDDTGAVVAYWTNFPHVTIYCPEHGQDRPNLIPRTADDLPFGDNCTTCGRDVLIPADQSDPTTADDPTPLRWGLGDVLHGDDDTTIVCLSGPDREPYWLELDPERAAALRDDLTPPTQDQTALDRVRAVADEWAQTAQRYPDSRLLTETVVFVLRTALAAPAVGQPTEAHDTEPPLCVWQVVREDEQTGYNLYGTVDDAKRGSVHCWEEEEAPRTDYQWCPFGDGWELLVGNESSGIVINRLNVYGAHFTAARKAADTVEDER